MPSTFKLSQRLARMKLPLAIAAAAFAACELPVRVTDPTPPNSPVVQIVSSPDSVTLDPDQTQQFVAYGRTQAGDSVAVAVSWSASGGTITGGGLYTANSVAGNYQVTATAQVSGSSQVKNRGPMAQIILTPLSASAVGGGRVQFAVYGKRKNGDSVAVSVAYAATGGSISGAGLYTAGQSAGTYQVIATQSGGTLASTAAVTISNVPVASVTVSPVAAGLTVGATTQLTATPEDSTGTALTGRAVTWATSNPAVATVSASGLVTGVAAGSATITATSEGQSGTSALTVTNVPVASVTVSPAAATVTLGTTTQLIATPKDANGTALSGRAVTWATSNAAIATVSASGLVTGVAAGSATITATSEGQSGTAALTVTNGPVASVTVSPATASLTVGATTQLTATPKDANGTALSGRVVTWGTSNAAIATVSASGLARGVAAGSATITATSEGKSGTAAMTVTNVPVATVTVTPAIATLLTGATLQLTATPRDALGNPLSGRVVTWSSNALSVASVTGTGLVTGVAVGFATITATSEGVSGSAAITVTVLSTGGNYYVAPSGSDANPCSAAAPCFTMQRVSQLLAPGDVAHFAAGNYSWGVQNVSVSGTASARITYISDVKWGAKITGGCPALENNGDYVDFVNFDVTGSCATGIMVNGNYNGVIGNHVHDLPGNNGGYGGILVDCCKYTSKGDRIIGNVVHDIATSLGQSNTVHGIYVANAATIVQNNIVYRAAGWGLQLWHCPTNDTLSNNTVFNNFNGGIVIGGNSECPFASTNSNSVINNNIVYNNGTASNANGYGIEEYASGGKVNAQYANNLVYGNSPGNWNLMVTGGQGTNTVTAAPLFINYNPTGWGDYHEAVGSPSIDAGKSLAALPYDYDGVPRPYGASYDIGAYEWHP